MLRQLLTLLAVIGGLTAAVEPVRAMEAGVASVELAERQSATSAQEVIICTQGATLQLACVVVRPKPGAAAEASLVPATILKADRALE